MDHAFRWIVRVHLSSRYMWPPPWRTPMTQAILTMQRMRPIKTSTMPLKKRKSCVLPSKFAQLRSYLKEEARIITYLGESGNSTSPTGLQEINKIWTWQSNPFFAHSIIRSMIPATNLERKLSFIIREEINSISWSVLAWIYKTLRLTALILW